MMTRREILTAMASLVAANDAIAAPTKDWRANRRYSNALPTSMARCRDTHVRVTGKVTLARHEDDGDYHFRIADEKGNFVVCEIVPYLPHPHPRVGQVVTVEGIRRYDDEGGHGWWEIHPVENWSEQ